MAVRSPLSVLSYLSHPASPTRSFSASAAMPPNDSLTTEHINRSDSSAPFPNSTGSSENSPDSASKGPENMETGKRDIDEGGNAVAAVHGFRHSAQQELTIQTSESHRTGLGERSDEDEPPQSVIHAPSGFGEFTKTQDEPVEDSGAEEQHFSRLGPSDPANAPGVSKQLGNSPVSPPPLTTTSTATKDCSERATPRAQTRHEFEEDGRRTRSSSLEDIPEGNLVSKEVESNTLRTALAECWTLCNTLASLSHIHRERLLASESDNMQEHAWRSCWRLCQKLYDTRDDDYASQVNPTLDLCRDFCQALFEVRVRDGDLADSVLRVSFELNNHLFNTHDRNLPDAFRERTLDFYITLCHRLMKQRTGLSETDSLLSACWNLAEMLFSIRQSKREGKPLDEELLGSAVQACWELCDIFREGWTLHSLRNSDRGTPRPSQTTFTQAFHQATRSELDLVDDPLGQLGNPETPTTIFEDTATVSPDEATVPNILVLGHGTGHGLHAKWSSNASSISEKSRSSGHTASSANTVTTVSEEPNFTRLRVLITRAALDSGYQRNGAQNVSSFVKSLSSDAFGSAPWQTSLLKDYRKLVAYDPAFKNVSPQARVSAVEVARACQAMLQSGQFPWLRDLYRLVFGFHMEEAMGRKGVTIQT